MTQPLRLVLVLHNHQPIGNFEGVCEEAYQDSYLPFLDVFERFQNVRIALHTSGSLIEWIDRRHPEYLDRLAGLVAAGRVEIVGGAFMEPILTMIPPRDRVGQITSYRRWLEARLGGAVRGMWMPERVWEQTLTPDLAEAGVEYTVLDDFHFKKAGLRDEQLDGYYLTEDDGRLLRVLPGSERLRYLLPFLPPHETINFLRSAAERRPGAVMIFGDDGEKFGTWPGTKKHVYDDGWLAGFFSALEENSDWIHTVTPAEMIDAVAPLGKVYIPEASYREMTEWALPAARINEYEDLQHTLQDQGLWEQVQPFMRGGYWRNFKVKYPETNTMYCRMMMVSRRLEEAASSGIPEEVVEQARLELYRGQCNCSYWHGAFGGIYLPHLRNAVYQHLIAAENILDDAEGRGRSGEGATWVELTSGDYNLDGRPEARLANNRLVALVAPAEGGQVYELDVRSICHNLQATLARRPEAYHRKVLGGAGGGDGDVASIHDMIVFKQEGLEERVQEYDHWRRNSLVDHFYGENVPAADIVSGEAEELGDFVTGAFEAKLRRNDGRVQLQMVRTGTVMGREVKMTKGISLSANSTQLEVAYLLEGLSGDVAFQFAPELNLAGLPSGADDRYFRSDSGRRLGQLGEKLDLGGITEMGLVDEWLGIDVGISFGQPTAVWTYPVESVSQSEGGFELVHQSVTVVPHWTVVPDAEGRWSVTARLTLDTQRAEKRAEENSGCVTV